MQLWHLEVWDGARWRRLLRGAYATVSETRFMINAVSNDGVILRGTRGQQHVYWASNVLDSPANLEREFMHGATYE